MSPPAVLPSVTCHSVGTLVAIISQLNTQPACAPVNASRPVLRLATHDSGTGWLAKPFLYGSFIHYSKPVYPGALNKLSIREILTRLRSLYETTWWNRFRFPGSALVWMVWRIFSAPCEPASQN